MAAVVWTVCVAECESYMHDVGWGVKHSNVVFQDIKMKSWTQQPSLARPHLAVTYQQTLSWNIWDTEWGSWEPAHKTSSDLCLITYPVSQFHFHRFKSYLLLKSYISSMIYLTHQAMDADGCRLTHLSLWYWLRNGRKRRKEEMGGVNNNEHFVFEGSSNNTSGG